MIRKNKSSGRTYITPILRSLVIPIHVPPSLEDKSLPDNMGRFVDGDDDDDEDAISSGPSLSKACQCAGEAFRSKNSSLFEARTLGGLISYKLLLVVSRVRETGLTICTLGNLYYRRRYTSLFSEEFGKVST